MESYSCKDNWPNCFFPDAVPTTAATSSGYTFSYSDCFASWSVILSLNVPLLSNLGQRTKKTKKVQKTGEGSAQCRGEIRQASLDPNTILRRGKAITDPKSPLQAVFYSARYRRHQKQKGRNGSVTLQLSGFNSSCLCTHVVQQHIKRFTGRIGTADCRPPFLKHSTTPATSANLFFPRCPFSGSPTKGHMPNTNKCTWLKGVADLTERQK